MSVVSKWERKNKYRKLEAERVRVERVICGYVKHRHPDIYSEGEEFYNSLNQLYPGKKDLRRCNEFERPKQGENISIKKYYIRKKPTIQHTVKDSMVLNIPLMDGTDIDKAQTPTVNETGQETVEEVALESSCQLQQVNQTIQETTEEVVLESSCQLQQVNQTIQETTEEAVVQASFTEPPLSEDIMELLIKGLREDPDICGLFDNIDFELDNCPLW